MGFPAGSNSKEPTCQCRRQERWIPSLGWGDPLEQEMTTHSSILVWRSPWKQKPGKLHSMRSQRVGHNWSDLACKHTNTSTVLPKKIILTARLKRIKLFPSDLTASQRGKKCTCTSIGTLKYPVFDQIKLTTYGILLQNYKECSGAGKKKKRRSEMKQEKSQWIKTETEMKQMIP